LAKKTKIPLDAWSALFWFTSGLLLCYGANRLGLGSITDPGSGFIFFWSGMILAFLSLMLLADSLRQAAEETRAIYATNWVRIAFVLSSLVLYAVLLEKLGFVLTTFALLSFLLELNEDIRRARVFTVAGIAALGSFAIFELWLKIRLPTGIFGF
jgi:putative tricarboxylic transport membrane protein